MHLIKNYLRNLKHTNYANPQLKDHIEKTLQNPRLFFKHKKVTYTVHTTTTCDEILFSSTLKTPYPENNYAHAFFYRQHSVQLKGIIIMLHGWKIDSQTLYKVFINKFVNNGYGVIFLELPYHLHRTPAKSYSGEYFISANLQRTIDAYRQAVLDVRCVIDFALQHTKNIALCGTSLGAIVAALTLPFDNRIKGVISIVGGGNIAEICWNGISTVQVKRDFVQHNLPLKTVVHAWKVIDPLTYAHPRLKDRMLMINAEKDAYIPSRFTEALWEQFGKPKIVWLPTGHVGFVLHIHRVMKEAFTFLEERFTQ